MKKKVIIIVCILLAILAIPIALIGFAFGLPAQYDQSFYGGMKIKYDRLTSIKDRKIVIIGGSSVAFGIRSDLMEEEIGIPVVNFGLYANLGTKYMLDVAKDSIKKDDIVLIAPEQNSQALSNYFNGEAVWYTADGNFKVLKKVEFENYGDLAKSFLTFVSGKFGYNQAGTKPRPEGVYNVDAFNEYGDISYERPYNVMPAGYDVTMPISFNKQTISNDFIEYLNSYAEELQGKGAQVYYSFCPMNADALEDGTTEENVAEYYDCLKDSLKFKILGNPISRILDNEWFYDSNFHLNTNGAQYYTRRVILDLKVELNDFTDVKFPVPEKPQLPQDDSQNSDNQVSEDLKSAIEKFNLSIITQRNGQRAWRIDGLTGAGRALTEIEIPDYIAGIPVAEIAGEAFAGDTAVVKIIFGKNINSVGEKAFNGCSSLTGVYITSLDPNSFHPATTIFDGADNCAFYIPAQVYASDYLTDYFWGALDMSLLKSY